MGGLRSPSRSYGNGQLTPTRYTGDVDCSATTRTTGVHPMTREPYSFRASPDEMHAIEEAARVIGVPPRALVRNAAVATARRVLDAVKGAAREAAGSVATQAPEDA